MGHFFQHAKRALLLLSIVLVAPNLVAGEPSKQCHQRYQKHSAQIRSKMLTRIADAISKSEPITSIYEVYPEPYFKEQKVKGWVNGDGDIELSTNLCPKAKGKS